jgi:basic amino acid/polyamine antiporter, APA family
MSSRPSEARLLPTLGLFTTITIVVGGMIGSGIFRNPSTMAAMVQSPELLLGVWVVAGLVSLFGALTNAEVAGLIPATGGQYQYFRTMYGDFTAYMYGWALFAVIQTGSIASISFVFSEYFATLFPLWELPPSTVQAFAVHLPFGTIYPLGSIGVKLLTCALVTLLTFINTVGVREGGRVQALFTTAKVAAILFLVGAAFLFGDGSVTHITAEGSAPPPVGSALFLALVMAMNKALWSYDGWNNITYVAGEVKEPQRTIPRALMIGTATTMAVYVLINIAYLYILPIDALGASTSVAADVARAVFGPFGLTFVAVAVMVSTLGTSNGTILASSRVYYAMAVDGMFFRSLATVHPTHHTPTRSLWWQLGWTSVLIFSGTFDMLTDMLIFVSWVFYGLGAYGVFVLRRRMPEAHRPYRTWGYPVVPIVFIAFAVVFLVFTIVSDVKNYADGTSPVINSLWGMILLAAGIPFYVMFRRRAQDDAPRTSRQG